MSIMLKDRSIFFIKSKIIFLKHRIDARPGLKKIILWFFIPFPGIKNKFKSIKPANKLTYLTMRRIDTPEQLPKRAKKIYHDLQKEIQKKKRERG